MFFQRESRTPGCFETNFFYCFRGRFGRPGRRDALWTARCRPRAARVCERRDLGSPGRLDKFGERCVSASCVCNGDGRASESRERPYGRACNERCRIRCSKDGTISRAAHHAKLIILSGIVWLMVSAFYLVYVVVWLDRTFDVAPVFRITTSIGDR